MVEIKNKQIWIDGRPQIVMCGEIHYYRLAKEDWQDRIDKLKDAGFNAVASYIPWLCHEPEEGQFDLTGRTRPELDLVGFVELCADNGLYFIARPGPFIMAEMKNEGLPYWVYEKFPEIVPVTWDGRPVSTKTVDYLAPSFLRAARSWYAEVIPVLAGRLHGKGGNVIGLQLDNEVGMLSWVSNSPDLTDNVLSDFAAWLKLQYDAETLAQRYPFNLDEEDAFRKGVRSPSEQYAAELRQDLGYYMRRRFAKYIAELRRCAEEFGASGIPFLVNIHGTGGGRGFTYPIGISQLYESYTQAPGYLSGSDIYFGDLNMESFQDLYLINGFMDAVHLPDQPLASLEFNCGDANFGETFGGRLDPSAADFKTRMCIAQGNRLINFYLFSGGYNYRMDLKLGDGNDRIAFTGERHGFAAPVGPDGELRYTYLRMARVNKTVLAVADKLAVMDEERDDVAFAFIPDYYMTEYRYRQSAKMREIVQNIEANRAHGPWEIMARAMLLAGYRFGSVDVQNRPIDPGKTKVIALPSARYMHAHIQRKLADFMVSGGSVLLYGEVPLYDMEGKHCTILADALGVEPKGARRVEENYYLSLCADGWAAPRPEVRSHFAQIFEHGNTQPIMRVYGTDEVCAFEAEVGKGKAVVFAAAYRCDIPLFREALERLGATAGITQDGPYHGVFVTSTATQDGERFIHMLNLDGFDKEIHIYDKGQPLFEGRSFVLSGKDGVMLPVNVVYHGVKIVYSTAEITAVTERSLQFRLTQPEDIIAIGTDREIMPSGDYVCERSGSVTLVRSRKHARVDDRLTIGFR
ncbi:glycosyl hydrolase [Paenibacillus darwinianus]|uniref:Glycosyl hydrolase n=1 Tax=Paenibacillus darwinianus TaxID=1380763 RepID=A0A9W5RZS9_9BACL|nr:beta-galactosidase [Paenibacillus darwinianus]EXX86707.1 glycosyl hydrolase [Paenibacillus darwinianus]EXX86733.1 glycosyl hydrolase [Paenibacillus darwinianus]EXX87464.1 glycosyl hydrolase [Paenibacillus darwinianus]